MWILYLIRQKPFCVLWIKTTPPPLYHIDIGPWKPFAGTKVTKTKSTADAPGATIKKAFSNCYKMNCIICRNKPVILESMFVGAKFIPHFKNLLGVLCWMQQLCNSLAGLKGQMHHHDDLGSKCAYTCHLSNKTTRKSVLLSSPQIWLMNVSKILAWVWA